nr:diphthine--ammonia ligase [Sedimentibacter sp.]
MNKKCFVSWSGGKDSCLALYSALEKGYKPEKLLTMFSSENEISSAHRLNEQIFRKQAESIGIENVIVRAKFDEYESSFVNHIKLFKEQGIDYGIFGDIDLEEHRHWEEMVCEKSSIKAVLPLWKLNRKEIVEKFITLGFKAKIIVVNTTMLDTKFLGQDLTIPLIKEIESYGADACGENGEYHTVVYDGPIFKNPIELIYNTEIIPVGEKWAQIEIN